MFSPLFSNICPLKVIEHILSFHYMYYECAHIHVHVKDLGSLDIHIILLVDYLLNHNLDVKIGYRQSLVCINMDFDLLCAWSCSVLHVKCTMLSHNVQVTISFSLPNVMIIHPVCLASASVTSL